MKSRSLTYICCSECVATRPHKSWDKSSPFIDFIEVEWKTALHSGLFPRDNGANYPLLIELKGMDPTHSPSRGTGLGSRFRPSSIQSKIVNSNPPASKLQNIIKFMHEWRRKIARYNWRRLCYWRKVMAASKTLRSNREGKLPDGMNFWLSYWVLRWGDTDGVFWIIFDVLQWRDLKLHFFINWP